MGVKNVAINFVQRLNKNGHKEMSKTKLRNMLPFWNKYLLLFVAILGCTTLMAQKDDDLETGSVEVIRSFDARLLDSEKIEIAPSLPAIDTTTKYQSYNVPAKTLNIEYQPPRLRPLAFRSESLNQDQVYNGMVKLGGGAPSAIFGELGYSGDLQENLNLGFFADHYSANNSSNVENQRFGLTNVKGTGNYYSDYGFAVDGHVDYTHDVVHWYGYNAEREEGDTTSVDADMVRQVYNTIDIGAKVFNGSRNVGDINYSVGVDYYRIGDESPARENGFEMNLLGEKWFNNRHPLQIGIDLDFSRYRSGVDSTLVQRLNNYRLSPNYTYVGGNFRVKAGIKLASSDDNFNIFPDLEIGANVIDGILTIFIGADGDLRKNNFRNLTDYNPYLLSEVTIRNTNFRKYYIGAQGKYRGISYRVEGGYKNAQDLALFLSDNGTQILPNRFDPRIYRFNVLYDDVEIINLKGSVEMDVQGFNLSAILSQNFYTPSEQEKAWHLPAFTLNVGASYNELLQSRLTVKGELFLQNGVPFLNDEGNSENLDGLYDLNVLADYEITERFNGFVNFYNILNNKRQRWQRYPTFGFNLLVGVGMKL